MRRVWVLLPILVRVVSSQYFTQLPLSESPGSDFIPDDPVAKAIVSRALKDGIVLSEFAFTGPALREIVFWSRFNASQFPRSLLEPAKKSTAIDVHAHYAPRWYGDIRQDPTEWTLRDHLVHMRNHSITESVFSVPNPNIFLGDEKATRAIARLLNENMAVLVQVLPRRFNFFATTPLPHVHGSITEARYALESLGALDVALSSNHEGLYLGDTLFTPFFSAMDNSRAIIFVHPTEASLVVNHTFVKANPTIHSPVLAEFYFETARTFLDLAISQTLANFTNLDFIISHLGGSFPSIIDRGIPPGPVLDEVMVALRTRCWWDSAGLTYGHQLGGLLAYNISPSYLLCGSDHPYVPSALVPAASEAIAASPFLNEQEKLQVRAGNAQRLFGGRKRRETV
ncbi:hypothetical protein B0H17DRAFT_178374 [Mycena rosella]|uniref:Amidohydrolase-related domain-containing protein n=1 Tax=Mycena rosella TaxID=1033263 RepID=A0AAD7D0A7_MYCRO|nr:hypothetical protein B0H17DRAFT_178374 [Mycena rosella]